MTTQSLQTRHIYEHDVDEFENRLNSVLREIVEQGGVVGDIKYASDAATQHNTRGGFGALIIFEI